MKEKGRPRGFDRAAALRRAMEVFWAKGFEGASMTELTTAMGIGSPSLYAAFGSKEALFAEAVDLYSRSEGTEIWSAIETAPTAREAFEWFLRRSAASFSRPGTPAGCLIVLGALHADKGSENVYAALRQRRAANVTELQARIERAIGEGELPAGIHSHAIALFYVTVQQGMSIQARDGAGEAALMAVADGAMAAWERLTAQP